MHAIEAREVEAILRVVADLLATNRVDVGAADMGHPTVGEHGRKGGGTYAARSHPTMGMDRQVISRKELMALARFSKARW